MSAPSHSLARGPSPLRGDDIAVSGSTATHSQALLEAQDLHVHFVQQRNLLGQPQRWLRAVDGVTLALHPGETLGLVGESGCGKSTLGRTLLGLRPATAGRVLAQGEDLATLGAEARKALRRQMQLVFQDPYAALNPRETVGDAVRAGLDIHAVGSKAQRQAQVADLFERVGLSPSMIGRWPHEFSGGQRQRIVIARALALQPRLLVCDEPVSALDVSIQAQILNLLKTLQAERGLAMLFVSHNLAVVEHMADRVAVMYRGRIVETGPRQRLFDTPQHPYTQALLAAVPTPDPRRRALPLVRGDSATAASGSGCRFAGRCPVVHPVCREAEPDLAPVGDGHQAACWRTRSA